VNLDIGLMTFDLQAVTLDHFAVSDDPRWPAVLAGFQGAREPMLQSERERRSAWPS
jgi:hypothetical protein